MLNKIFLNKIKKKLLSEKQELLNKSSIVPLTDIDMDGDETDIIQGNILVELHNKLNSRNKLKLNQIDSALKRIEEMNYGICKDCEENIPEKRLSYNPYFLTCVSCSEEQEIEAKKRKKF